MGIKGLNAIISENVPHAIRKSDIKNFFGRKVAIDASMSLYQFLIAVRQQDGMNLSNAEGETTSHLMGMFYRTLRMIDNGIKPVYVFDGKPPVLKKYELDKRLDRRTDVMTKMEDLKDNAEKQEEYNKLQRRTVKVTKQQNDEAKHLLKLMGIPYVEAPCEAEAQCAELAKCGKVYAAASEDMDTLCYKTPFLLRHLTFSEQRKEPIHEIDTDKILAGLDLTLEQFVDLCILLGCDYCPTIKGCGPVNALKLIKEHKSIENIIACIENPEKNAGINKKWTIPENWDYKEARELFLNPEIVNGDTVDLKWETPNETELLKFMCEQNGFAEDRIKSGIERLKKGLKTGTQGRLDGFFKVIPKTKEQLQKKNGKLSKKEPKGKITKKRR
ncbi:Elongation of fatty acids protein 2 [Hanseniaspora vineae]